MTAFDLTFTDYVGPTGWRLSTALEALQVRTEEFNHESNPDADGYSYGRTLAIHPEPKLWTVPIIAAHELAHIVLGHTAFVAEVEKMQLSPDVIPVAQFELEAHQVTKAVGFALKLSAQEFMLDHVQRYIDSCKAHQALLRPGDAIRLARATLTIVDAGEGREVSTAIATAEEVYA